MEAIVDAEDTSPEALASEGNTALAEYINPDALDNFLRDYRSNNLAITASIDEYTVQITDSTLVVRSPKTSEEACKTIDQPDR